MEEVIWLRDSMRGKRPLRLDREVHAEEAGELWGNAWLGSFRGTLRNQADA